MKQMKVFFYSSKREVAVKWSEKWLAFGFGKEKFHLWRLASFTGDETLILGGDKYLLTTIHGLLSEI
jgi:hypothetical protein